MSSHNLTEQVFQSRQLLLAIIKSDYPFNSKAMNGLLVQKCLDLFDTADYIFNSIQLTILFQITTNAMLLHLAIDKILAGSKYEVYFGFKHFSLKVEYLESKDLYNVLLTNTQTSQDQVFNDLHFDDCKWVLQNIK